MLIIVALLVCVGLYLFARRREKLISDTSSVEIYSIISLKNVSGTAAVVAASFFVVQELLRIAPNRDWANDGLLTVERTLVAVKVCMDFALYSYYTLILSGFLLFLVLLLQILRVYSQTIRNIFRNLAWFARASLALTLLTSFTFFGTGSLSGLPNLEAKLIDDITRIERGLSDLAVSTDHAAGQALEAAAAEVLNDEGLPQLISESLDHDEVTDAFPLIVWNTYIDPDLRRAESSSGSQHRQTVPSPLGQKPSPTYDEAIRLIAGAVTRSHLDATVDHFRSHFSQAEPSIESLHSEQARLPAVNITLDRLERARAELVQEVRTVPNTSAYNAEYDALVQALHLSINLAGGRVKGEFPIGFEVENPLLGVFLVLVDEAVSEGLKKILKDVSGEMFRSIVSGSERALNAYHAGRESATARFRNLYHTTVQPQLKAAHEKLKSRRTAISDIVMDNKEQMREASAMAQRSRVDAIGTDLHAYTKDLTRNQTVNDGLTKLWQEIERGLMSLSGSAAAEQLVRVEARIQQLRAGEAGIDAPLRVTNLLALEREFNFGTHFRRSILTTIDLTMDVEHRGRWGRVREVLEDAVDNRRMNVSEVKKDRAADALRGWRNERTRIALEHAFSQFGAQSLSLDAFESEFARYLQRSPDMTALWGFSVIGVLELREFAAYVERSAERFAREELERYPKATARQFAQVYGENYSLWKRRYRRLPDRMLAAEILKEYSRAAGPKPGDGYLHYMQQTGKQARNDAWTWVTSEKVNSAVDRICPN